MRIYEDQAALPNLKSLFVAKKSEFARFGNISQIRVKKFEKCCFSQEKCFFFR